MLGPSEISDWLREVVQQREEVKFEGWLERGRPGAARILNRIVIGGGPGLGVRGGSETGGELHEGRGH